MWNVRCQGCLTLSSCQAVKPADRKARVRSKQLGFWWLGGFWCWKAGTKHKQFNCYTSWTLYLESCGYAGPCGISSVTDLYLVLSPRASDAEVLANRWPESQICPTLLSMFTSAGGDLVAKLWPQKLSSVIQS